MKESYVKYVQRKNNQTHTCIWITGWCLETLFWSPFVNISFFW